MYILYTAAMLAAVLLFGLVSVHMQERFPRAYWIAIIPAGVGAYVSILLFTR